MQAPIGTRYCEIGQELFSSGCRLFHHGRQRWFLAEDGWRFHRGSAPQRAPRPLFLRSQRNCSPTIPCPCSKPVGMIERGVRIPLDLARAQGQRQSWVIPQKLGTIAAGRAAVPCRATHAGGPLSSALSKVPPKGGPPLAGLAGISARSRLQAGRSPAASVKRLAYLHYRF